MFRNHDLVQPQYFSHADWTGGATITHGAEGSRSQGMLAQGYYAMLRIGRDGYQEKTRNILKTAHRFRNIIYLHPELHIMGDPTMIVAFNAANAEKLNIMHVADVMKQLQPSWRFNPVQYPAGLHFCITGPQTWGGNDSGQCSGDLESEADGVFTVEKPYDCFSDAALHFSVDLSDSLPVALYLKRKGKPALTGSMYGMGAAGIPIENPTVADSILQAGKHATLQPVTDGLEPLYELGRHIVDKNTRQKLQLPAY